MTGFHHILGERGGGQIDRGLRRPNGEGFNELKAMCKRGPIGMQSALRIRVKEENTSMSTKYIPFSYIRILMENYSDPASNVR